jgi:hypothetical protein
MDITPWALLMLPRILIIGLVVLQFVGLGFAIRGFRDSKSILERQWCSPAFGQVSISLNGTVDEGLSSNVPLAYDGTRCGNNHTITINPQGTGCINLVGDQSTVLCLTIIVVTFEILLEAVDVYLLIKFRHSETYEWLRLRPVCTMVFGVAVWVTLTVIAGVQSSSGYYPLGSNLVGIHAPPQPDCSVMLDAAGLRGEIIAWSDGIFSGLQTWYYGPFGKD